jgi:hypothetical protein
VLGLVAFVHTEKEKMETSTASTDTATITEQAHKELQEERFKEAVDKEKRRLRERDGRSFWQRIFPFVITIKRS